MNNLHLNTIVPKIDEKVTKFIFTPYALSFRSLFLAKRKLPENI